MHIQTAHSCTNTADDERGSIPAVDVAQAVDRCGSVAGITAPIAADQARYEEVYVIYRGLYGALREGMHRLASV